ncbi:5'-nucleotidase domain-containing protein 3-like isoform X1 [Amphibalanus amphitrite]|uniref:5'-nucleotidase domain-containing protein 3-like isoform X1 n=1 Tax=Amphibalanus amphitrite TaxID=1232801 RepID=UPI001C914E65|nr:5'-nucleotidase domain-containing protein 3-like isoform X1 [Amphibalanus amphitrite]
MNIVYKYSRLGRLGVITSFQSYHGQRHLSVKSHRNLLEAYESAKRLCFSKKPPPDVNPRAVFANNEIHLRNVSIYGFDYDYTLAHYKPSMHHLIYDLGKKALVEKFKYPKDIENLRYLPDFAVRGLHYDIHKGLLIKVDSFNQIQLGSVYRGLSKVSDAEVMELYGSTVLPINYIEPPPGRPEARMVQLADLFSLPEMCLMCQVTDLFIQQNIDFQPAVLFTDVRNAIGSIHPLMHGIVGRDPAYYMEESPDLVRYLDRLVQHGRRLFLVTNSPFDFVNRGMNFLVGDDWRDRFDLVIVEAKKPKFFTQWSSPLRRYDLETKSKTWSQVTKIEKGEVYCEGNVRQLQQLTGWAGGNVLYFGDHPYTDLADVRLHHGWRTGAILWELDHEISILNRPEYKENSNWLQQLQQLIEGEQNELRRPENRAVLERWEAERDQLRLYTKTIFNHQFGSLFRTHHNPSYFSRRLFHFCDLYTSSISNLLDLHPSHVFFPRRGALPHEYRSMFV